jgi:hypothetical protein
MTAVAGTPTGAVAWAQRQLGATPPRITHWNAQAPGEWCGVWMAAAMRAMGFAPPSGYKAAHAWESFGTPVKPGEEQPGDILVYGYQHVAMFVGQGQMISGNWSGTVGSSAVPAEIEGTPLTAIRRPPYKSGFERSLLAQGKSPAEARKVSEGEGLKSGLGDVIPSPGEAVSTVAGEVVSGVENLLGEKAVPILLNVGLVGGGAFLAYFGIARMVGVGHPVKTPIAAAAAAAPAAAA